jgi:L-lactate utilization protein LutB
MNYATLAPKESVDATLAALGARNFEGLFVNTKEEALAKIEELIPQGASVMNGASRTLEEIGYIAYLKHGGHGWNNLHETILKEEDAAKKALLRKQSVVSDFYLGSAHAIAQTGELVFASNSGSQFPHLAFTSQNVILVASTKKIVPTLADAFDRIDTHVVPLEDARMRETAGYGTLHAKTLILHKENPAMGRKVHVILVNEDLGF